jgi:hypothetical protein
MGVGMAYDRRLTGRWAWLKSVGSADDPLEDDWLHGRDYLLSHVWYPKHPRSIRGGDLLVYYASGRGGLPAVVEVATGDVEESRDHPRHSERWPWRMAVRPRLVVPRLRDAPRLTDVGIDPLRVRRQSHIRLGVEEVQAVRAAFVPRVDDEQL